MIQMSEGQSCSRAGLPGKDMSDSHVLIGALWHTGSGSPGSLALPV